MDVRGGTRAPTSWRRSLTVRRGQTGEWLLVADVGRGPSEVAELRQLLRRPARLRTLVEADIDRGTRELQQIIASADGLQKTAQPLGDVRHSNNVLFNVMRGGDFRRRLLRGSRGSAGLRSPRPTGPWPRGTPSFFRRLKPGSALHSPGIHGGSRPGMRSSSVSAANICP